MLDDIAGFSDPGTAVTVTSKMEASGCPVSLYLYPDTPHSFLNALVPGGKEFLEKWSYGVPPITEAELAFDRFVAFLDKHCKMK